MYSLVSRHKVDLVREDHSTYVAKDVTFILENGRKGFYYFVYVHGCLQGTTSHLEKYSVN